MSSSSSSSSTTSSDHDVHADQEEIETVKNMKWSDKTKYSYGKSIIRFLEWIKRSDRYCHMIEANVLNREFRIEAFLAFCNQLRKRDTVTNESVLLSYSALNGYKSAVMYHLRKVASIELTLEEECSLSEYFAGVKKRCAKEKQDGRRNMEEGKDLLPFSLYRTLAQNFWQNGDLFSVCYLTLTWNLGCRTNNTEGLKIAHIGWKEDALLIQFGQTKSNKEGCRKEARLIYANPDMPDICPVLTLGAYLASLSTPLDSHDALFIGGSQATRFHRALKEALKSENLSSPLLALGLSPSSLGAHSIRKGAGTYLCSNSTVSPPYPAICVRMGWTMGVQDRYLKYDFGADGYCGRVLAGLDQKSADFALLPPHTFPPLDFQITASSFPSVRNISHLEPVKQFCYCSLLYHKKFLQDNVPQNCRLLQSNFFRSHSQYGGSILTGIKSIALSSSGVPPHVQTWLKQDATDNLIREIRHDMPKELLDGFGDKLREEGVAAGNVTRELLRETISASMREVLQAQREQQHTQNVTESASCTQYQWADGKLHLLPEDYNFPNVSVSIGWHLWWEGNSEQNVPPYYLLASSDIPKGQRKRFSDIRCYMRFLINILEQGGMTQADLIAMPQSDLDEACRIATEQLPRRKKLKHVRTLEWVVCTALRELRQAQAEERAERAEAETSTMRRTRTRPARYCD